jgi:hypothetical protein
LIRAHNPRASARNRRACSMMALARCCTRSLNPYRPTNDCLHWSSNVRDRLFDVEAPRLRWGGTRGVV